jgi:hypothetical protein
MTETSLFVATPCYGGMVNVYFMESIVSLIMECSKHRIKCKFFHVPFESLIPRARNICASAFLKLKATHLMFIDADIEFKASDVIRMIRTDVDLIGGSYPTKHLDIKGVASSDKGLTDQELVSRNVQYTSKLIKGKDVTKMTCEHLATGFMLIHRRVLQKLVADNGDIQYINDIPAYAEYTQAGGVVYDFFQSKVVNGKYMSEDYGFCELWKQSGGQLYTDLTCKLNHIGNFTYYGNHVSKLTR